MVREAVLLRKKVGLLELQRTLGCCTLSKREGRGRRLPGRDEDKSAGQSVTDTALAARQEGSKNLPETWNSRYLWSVHRRRHPGQVAGRVTGQTSLRTLLGADNRDFLCINGQVSPK